MYFSVLSVAVNITIKVYKNPKTIRPKQIKKIGIKNGERTNNHGVLG